MSISNYILYDSKCKFCSSIVTYCISKRREENIIAIAIQNKDARLILRKLSVSFIDLNTIYFVEGEKVYKRSVAIFQISKYLKFPLNTFFIFSFLPKQLTDFIYKWIAKNRYRL